MLGFQLDTSGVVHMPAPGNPGSVGPLAYVQWRDLDAFTQGYIEALFFTEEEALGQYAENAYGFRDLAPETLARIMRDHAAFQATEAWGLYEASANEESWGSLDDDDDHAGRDFWYTRNGHGCGFWDGDWPEPYATALTDVAKAFGACEVYLGDDGRVYLS